jgi:hypothetical protein
MSVLITYDIQRTSNTIHTEVKNAMIAKGYSEHVPILNGGRTRLPNTTLVRDNITPQTAANDLIEVCALRGATLEKYISLTISYEGGRVRSNEN